VIALWASSSPEQAHLWPAPPLTSKKGDVEIPDQMVEGVPKPGQPVILDHFPWTWTEEAQEGNREAPRDI
jgi:hypothetical protein